MKSTQYRHRGINGVMTIETVALTEKSADFDEISIKGVRWYSGTTYHVAYISARVGDTWKEIGKTEMHSGFGEHYLVTAGEWLIANGYLTAPDGYALGGWQVREAMGITHYSQDVKRKKDM